MSGSSDHRFDLNFGEEVAMLPQDNIWRPFFLSLTSPLTVRDSVMKNDMTAAVVAMNFLTPENNRLLSKRSDELAVKDSLALSVQCAGSVSNMTQCLFDQTRQVKSLAAEMISLKQEIRRLKHENKQLHTLAHNYATNMKKKLDQLQESDALNDQPSVPPPSRVLPSIESPNDHLLMPPLYGALPTAETSPEQSL
ncbi:unnamed protein product [Malus baccata var. baccata]